MKNCRKKPSKEMVEVLEAIALNMWLIAVREYENNNNPRLLNKQLSEALACEDYERACLLRDRLAQIKSKPSNTK